MVWHLLFGSTSRRRIAHGVYHSAVVRAREPLFYNSFGVSDSLDGRFDMISIHVFLILHRLKGGSRAARRLSQDIFDIMFSDMDRSLREIGVGDLSVGRKVKAMAKALNGRIANYDKGLHQQASLEEALIRNLYRGQQPSDRILFLMAQYVRDVSIFLSQQDENDILKGHINWGALPAMPS